MPYAVRQTLLDEPNARIELYRYWRSAFAENVADGLFYIAVEATGRFPCPLITPLFLSNAGCNGTPSRRRYRLLARCLHGDIDVIGQWDDARPRRGG